jgi:hypothetical protein
MSGRYPLRFTLEDGVKVVIHKTGANTYDFTLNPENGSTHHFTYVEDDRPKEEVEAALNFDELNALRRFWLENEGL